MCEVKKISFLLKIHSLIFTIFLLFFLTDHVYGSLKYYYIHVSSFQIEKKAIQFAQDLQKIGLETVVRGEEITDLGFWYRIYIGPFYSRLEAELESRELKGKGIIDYAAIHKKDSLLSSKLEEKPEPIEKSLKPVPEQTVIEITPPPEEIASVSKPPSDIPLIEKKSPITERPPENVPSVEERIALEKAQPPLKTKPGRKLYPKSPLKFLKKVYGRNTRQWGLALCLKHIYRDIQTIIIKRKGNQPLEEDKKNEFPTHIDMTSLQLRLGLTNYLEIFGNVGTAFNDPSELGFTYGGGLRLNLFEIKSRKFKGFYSAIQGEYLSGEFEEEYISNQNYKWQKETEWEEITAKVEFGFTRFRFTAYAGGTYFHYNEDTKRQQLEGPSPLGIAQDEIEEENSFGAYGGIAIHFTPALIVNLEGEVLSQKSISLALEYLF